MNLLASTRDRLRLQPLAACVVLALFASPLSASPFCTASTVRDAQRMATTASFAAPWRPGAPAHVAQPMPARVVTPAGRLPSTLSVTNCNDTGPGSLRETVAAAISGDTVDMSQLTCSSISLQMGQIATSADDLSIVGPGQHALTIEAGSRSRIFYSAGNLALSDLTVQDGFSYSPGGGCVRTLGDTSLARVTAQSCGSGSYSNYYSHYPDSIHYPYQGGGLLVGGNLTLASSTLYGTFACHCGALNHRYLPGAPTVGGGGAYVAGDAMISDSRVYTTGAGSNLGPARGGGLGVHGDLTITNSTIGDNGILGKEQILYANAGGALFVDGALTMSASTVSRNCAAIDNVSYSGEAGGLFIAGTGSTIVNSTITGNTAYRGGGIVAADVTIENSTIAFNGSIDGAGGAGMIVRGDSTIDSSILANNSATGAGVGAADLASDRSLVTISGANNLVMAADATITLPADTLHDDPLLAPLADNGGPTQTLALLPGSPALDAGNNLAGLTTDQRGPGFARIVGVQADIGAYEWRTDAIFADGFD